MQKVSVRELAGLRKDLDIFRQSAPFDPELLRAGLYTPLPVSGDFLIWGFHILSAALLQGEDELYCSPLKPLPVRETLRIALELEGRSGRYSWQEKENMFQLLKKASDSQGSSELSELIEGRRDPHLAEKLKAYSRLNPALKKLLADHLLDLKTALRAAQLPEAVFMLLKEKGRLFSFSRRRQFLDRFYEISLRERMNEREMISFLEQALASGAPLEMITRRRYPRLSSLEDRFTELLKSILKGTGIKLKAPPYFEGESFSVSFKFESRKSLSRKIQTLKSLEEKSDELFGLIH